MAIQPHSRIESQLTDPTYNGPYLSRIELILKDMLENYGRIAFVGPYDSLEDLPEIGEAGYVYLVRVEGSYLCDEYIWDEKNEVYNYVGRFEIDLADYQTKDLITPITVGSVTYTTVEAAMGAMNTSLSGKANSSDLGTAASKNSTDQLSDGSVDLIEAGAVKTALDGKVNTHGTDSLMTAEEHTKLSGIAANAQANVLEGVKVNGADLTIIDKKVNIDLTGKADKVQNATNGDIAGLDANGNLTDTGVSLFGEKTYDYAPILNIKNALPIPAVDCKVKVKPIQDLHGYDHPWVGGASANVLNPYDGAGERNSVTWTPIVDTGNNKLGYTVNGTASTNTPIIPFILPIVNAEKTYNIQYFDLPQGVAKFGWDETAGAQLSNISSGTIVIPANHEVYIGIYLNPNQAVSNSELRVMVSESTITDFIQYSNICPISGIDEVEIEVSDGESEPTTTTIPLPSTLYGGEVDVTNGDADSRFGYSKVTGVNNGSIRLNGDLYGNINGLTNVKSTPNNYAAGNALCNIARNVSADERFHATDCCIAVRNTGQIDICIPGITSQKDLNTYLAEHDVYVCYELATPTTISFDPADVELLEGTNVVTTNADSISMTVGGIVDALNSVSDEMVHKSGDEDISGIKTFEDGIKTRDDIDLQSHNIKNVDKLTSQEVTTTKLSSNISYIELDSDIDLDGKSILGSISGYIFKPNKSYAVGDYCYRVSNDVGTVYKCTTAHTGVWDENDFEEDPNSILIIGNVVTSDGILATKNYVDNAISTSITQVLNTAY